MSIVSILSMRAKRSPQFSKVSIFMSCRIIYVYNAGGLNPYLTSRIKGQSDFFACNGMGRIDKMTDMNALVVNAIADRQLCLA